MIRKMIPVFTAAAISMSITFVVPVAITAVSSFTFVSEAQAWGLKKIKRVAKRKYNKTKDIITCKTCPGGKWIDQHALKDALATPGKYIKRGGKSFIRDTKGAGQMALGTAQAAGRTIDRRSSQACVALGGCQGTITGGVSRGTKVTVNRR